MAIRNVGDAREVEDALGAILGAESEEDRAREIRRMFVETLDFDVVTEGERIPLDCAGHDALPADARRLASRDGMSAIYIPIDAPRVGAMPAGAAAKKIGNVLEGEFLMLFTNRDCNQLHNHPPGLERQASASPTDSRPQGRSATPSSSRLRTCGTTTGERAFPSSMRCRRRSTWSR